MDINSIPFEKLAKARSLVRFHVEEEAYRDFGFILNNLEKHSVNQITDHMLSCNNSFDIDRFNFDLEKSYWNKMLVPDDLNVFVQDAYMLYLSLYGFNHKNYYGNVGLFNNKFCRLVRIKRDRAFHEI